MDITWQFTAILLVVAILCSYMLLESPRETTVKKTKNKFKN